MYVLAYLTISIITVEMATNAWIGPVFKISVLKYI
jgi:hypothetical protein